MILISHRVNKIDDLIKTPKKYGVEIDIRSWANKLIVHHDPFNEGEEFNEWIKFYDHSFLILNVKEEGLEEKIIEILNKRNISDYFFLDQSFPFLIKYIKLCGGRSALRISEFESTETAKKMSELANWLWLDSFKIFSISADALIEMKSLGYKLCLVSPELQGREEASEIKNLISFFKVNQIELDAICTKKPSYWEKLLAHK